MRYSILYADEDQVRSAGGKNIKSMRNGNIVFADLEPKQAIVLENTGCIVVPVEKIGVSVGPPTPIAGVAVYTPIALVEGMGLNDIRETTDPPLRGFGYNLAIVGTGIRSTHELLRGRVVLSANYTDDPSGDGFDHDTGVASIAIAVAPDCNIIDVKVVDNDGVGSEENAVEAIDDLVTFYDNGHQYAPHVINLSFGAPDTGNPNTALRVICREAIDRGIYVFAAAGNSGPTSGTVHSPAAEHHVIAVGSCNYEPFRISNFSSRGPTIEGYVKPDIVMVGEDIEMASSSSDTATVARGGTSFSAPFASGLGIILKSVGTDWETFNGLTLPLSPENFVEVFSALVGVKPEGVATGKDNIYGYGLPYGPSVAQYIGPTVTAEEVNILSSLISVMVISMMAGVMTKMN